MLEKMNKSLDFLRDKYGFPACRIVAGNDYFELELDNKNYPLLPQRVERRFVELKKIVDGGTLEDVSTLRFAKFTAGGDLFKLLAEQLDLAEYLANSPIDRIFASGDGEKICNVIARFANKVSASIECGVNLPEGSKVLDRHEIIARRGVACDRGVDTQVPQHSIYIWSEDGESQFTDVDTELFGLSDAEIWNVRAAYAAAGNTALAESWVAAGSRALKLAEAALKSAKSFAPVAVEGESK